MFWLEFTFVLIEVGSRVLGPLADGVEFGFSRIFGFDIDVDLVVFVVMFCGLAADVPTFRWRVRSRFPLVLL